MLGGPTTESECRRPQTSRRLVVLGFHKIGSRQDGRDTWFYVSESRFADHLRWLEKSRWRVIGVDAFLAGLAAPDSLPDRAVLLTFDDGYRCMRNVALPVLRSFGFPGVVFVPTAFIGGCNAFDAGVEPEEAMCDWEDLSHLQQHSVSVQSHGVSHRHLSTLEGLDLERELQESKATLERRLGRPVETISYPYGDSGADQATWAMALERAGYKAGFLFRGGPNPVPIPNAYQIERLPVGPDTDLEIQLADEADE